MQAAAHAGMHLLGQFQVAGQQAVKGIGQGAVGSKAQRRISGKNLRQARMCRQVEAPSHEFGREAVTGHRYQDAILQMEQGHGIARQHLADGRDEALELHLAGHGVGKIDGDLPQGTINGFLETHRRSRNLALEARHGECLMPRLAVL